MRKLAFGRVARQLGKRKTTRVIDSTVMLHCHCHPLSITIRIHVVGEILFGRMSASGFAAPPGTSTYDHNSLQKLLLSECTIQHHIDALSSVPNDYLS